MKRFLLSIVVCVVLLTGCGAKAPAEPETEVVKADVQEYITELIDGDAIITYFLESDASTADEEYMVTCAVAYQSLVTEYRDEFVLTYTIQDKEWQLSKCRVNSDYSGKYKGDLGDSTEEKQESDSKLTATSTPPPELTATSIPSPTNTPTPEPTATPTSTPTPEPTATPAPVAAVSEKIEDFMFEMEGEVYRLPVLYQTFAEKGWHPDGKVTEDDELGGYSYLYCYLTNDIVRISAEIINMSGHVRKLKDCTIGSIEIKVSNNLDFSIAKGIEGTASKDEIIEAFGLPSSNSNYETSEYITYDLGTRKKVKFYLDYEKSYNNSITLQCYEATEHDATVVSEETPEYLAEYVKPKKVGSDVKATLFMLDGKRYRLPCPLSEFIDDGWEISQANIKSLGAWNYASLYDVTLKKGDVKINVGLLNCSEKEVYIKDCAVYSVSFETYYMKNIEEGYVKLPKSLTMSSTVEDIAKVCEDFSEYKGDSYASYTYQDSDNTIKVYYSIDDWGNKTIQLKNMNWEYK